MATPTPIPALAPVDNPVFGEIDAVDVEPVSTVEVVPEADVELETAMPGLAVTVEELVAVVPDVSSSRDHVVALLACVPLYVNVPEPPPSH